MFDTKIKSKFWIFIIGAFWFLVPYEITNHFLFFVPHQLPLILKEATIPFISWSVWVYLSVFFEIIIGLLIVPRDILDRVFKVAILLVTLHILIFIFFPTIYPRSNFVPQGINSFGYYLIKATDTPANCFPSEHVSVALFAAFVLLKTNKKIGTIFLVWAVLISISTLTTKQHYMLDIISAAVLAAVAYWFVFRGETKGTERV